MKRRLVRKLLSELREHVTNGVPHDLVFKPTAGLTDRQKKALQESLNDDFDRWRETWVFPWIGMLEQATGVNDLKR